MPREQLLGLATDVDRLLNAGATASSGNENLQRRSRSLRELGKKVAALNPVADAVEKVTQASGKQTAPVFLDLVAMMRQVRASLAGSGSVGELKPVAPSGPWKTPQSVRDLNPLYEALSKSGSGREETIKNAVERGAIGDMRLLPAMLAALGDQYSPLADLVAESVLPSLGNAVLPDLVATLDLNGKSADVRRLQAICRIDKKVGTELCRRAVTEGNVALRAKGIELLADLIPAAEMEKTALEFVKDKSKEVRNAALAALKIGKSDAVLDALCGALLSATVDGHHPAFESLKSLPNAGTPARLLKELEGMVIEATEPPAKKAKDKPAPSAKAKQAAVAAKQLALNNACALMRILGERKDVDRKSLAQALLPHTTGKVIELQTAALEALGGVGPVTKEVVPTLIAALGHSKSAVVEAALLGLRQLEPTASEPAFATVLELTRRAKIDHSVLGEAVLFVSKHWEKHTKEVEKLLREMLKAKTWERQSIAADAIREMGINARGLLTAMLETLSTGGLRYGLYEYFSFADPDGAEVIPHIIKLLSGKDARVKHEAIHVLRSYGVKAKAAVPMLTELLNSKDTYLSACAESILREMDR